MIRIGTWNLAHERNASPMVLKRQLDFMEAVDCDIWLLTEVPYTFRTVMGAASTTLSEAMDRTHKAFAAVWAKDGIDEEPAPVHEAAALAQVGGLRVCSCLLPSPSMPRAEWPDTNYDRTRLMRAAVARLHAGLAAGSGDLVWGGDWSHPFQADDGESAAADRLALREAIAELGLKHGMHGIDHVAVPRGWHVSSGSRLDAVAESDGRCSEHDAFVVEVEP